MFRTYVSVSQHYLLNSNLFSMSVSASIQIPYLKKGQLLAEWSKDYLRATVMLTDVQRVQLLPSYVCRTKGEKNLAESVSGETDFNQAIS